MRRFIAIILLGVHLFTIGAYAVALAYINQQPAVQMVKQLYNNKEDKNLIEIKIPIRMPGVSPWVAYEKIRGQIKLKNADYIYVSLKMSRDTMSLLCIPNKGKNHQLANANIILAKNIVDVPLGKKAHNASSKRTLDTQYDYQTLQYTLTALNIIEDKNYSRGNASLLNPFIKTKGQPPDYSC